MICFKTINKNLISGPENQTYLYALPLYKKPEWIGILKNVRVIQNQYEPMSKYFIYL